MNGKGYFAKYNILPNGNNVGTRSNTMNYDHARERTLKEFRAQKGLTQEMVANIVGISTSHYCNIENKNRGMNYRLAKRLSACFSVSVENVFKCSKW